MKFVFTATTILFCTAFLSAGLPHTGPKIALPKPTPTPPASKVKKNVRPEKDSTLDVKDSPSEIHQKAGQPVYFYEFVRPGFAYSQISIAHDEEGRGLISFTRDGDDERITDPIALSSSTLGKIKNALEELDFLNSNEEYQFEKDFSNLGNVTIAVKKEGRERTVKYNWTTNKNAKELMDEYRRIANEYTWIFEFNVARTNQPLRTPSMMNSLDGFLRRKEISDPAHLLNYLTGVSTDEKLPLIARNHALKLIQQIQKTQK